MNEQAITVVAYRIALDVLYSEYVTPSDATEFHTDKLSDEDRQKVQAKLLQIADTLEKVGQAEVQP